MTVMNDRPQAGSSLEDGTIELMQNRNDMADDDRGTAHGLSEYEEPPDYEHGKIASQSGGIKTNVVYRLEIFNTNSHIKSSQRQIQ